MKNIVVILAFALTLSACKSDKDKKTETATGGAAGVPSAVVAGTGGVDAGAGGTNSSVASGGSAGQN